MDFTQRKLQTRRPAPIKMRLILLEFFEILLIQNQLIVGAKAIKLGPARTREKQTANTLLRGRFVTFCNDYTRPDATFEHLALKQLQYVRCAQLFGPKR